MIDDRPNSEYCKTALQKLESRLQESESVRPRQPCPSTAFCTNHFNPFNNFDGREDLAPFGFAVAFKGAWFSHKRSKREELQASLEQRAEGKRKNMKSSFFTSIG